MEESGFYTAVGFVLALLFAAVMGLCVFALLYTDFAQSGGIVNDRERATLAVTAAAAASAGLISWWLQSFAAHRGVVTRFIYGTLTYLLLFCAFGGLLELANSLINAPATVDLSFSGLYWSSLGAFYSFTINMLGRALPPLIGLMVAAGLILAMVGPRRIY